MVGQSPLPRLACVHTLVILKSAMETPRLAARSVPRLLTIPPMPSAEFWLAPDSMTSPNTFRTDPGVKGASRGGNDGRFGMGQ